MLYLNLILAVTAPAVASIEAQKLSSQLTLQDETEAQVEQETVEDLPSMVPS